MNIREKAKQEWIDGVFNNAEEIDPGYEYHWTSIAIGFFLAKGFTIAEAEELRREVDDYI